VAEATKPTQDRVDAEMVEADYEPPMREDWEEAGKPAEDEEGKEIPKSEEVVFASPSSQMNPNVSEEEQGMDMAPVVLGPPAYGSPDPATSSVTLMPLEQYPEDSGISEDYGVQPEATEDDTEDAPGDDFNATQGAVDLAEAENVDLAQVQGTGDGGRITKADVESYLAEQDDGTA
jgi:pyruvate/2-oxoglutarate dehydrogenase complex dihydrolipoamide acyltransferase (E2) component